MTAILAGLFINSCDNTSANVAETQTEKGTTAVDSASGKDPIDHTAAVERVEKVDESGNTLRFNQRLLDGALEGKYERISPQGIKLEEANYQGGQYQGKRVLFFANTGDTMIVETYEKGRFEGPYQLYHPNGKLKMEGQYRDNAMAGQWYQYYDNGALKEVVTFSNNEENGPFKEYHPNGKLSAEGSYLHGDHEHGQLKVYDETGALIKIMECNQGICRTVWPTKNKKKT